MYYVINDGGYSGGKYQFIQSSINIDANCEKDFFEDMLSYLLPDQKAYIVAKWETPIYLLDRKFVKIENLFCPLEFFKWQYSEYKLKTKIIEKYPDIMLQLISKWESREYVLSKPRVETADDYRKDFPEEIKMINQIKSFLNIKTNEVAEIAPVAVAEKVNEPTLTAFDAAAEVVENKCDEPEPDDGLVIGFTGHRKFAGDVKQLTEVIKTILKKNSPTKCITGMALGFDTIAAEICIDLEIPFVAAVPFEGQDNVFPQESKDKYKEILSKAKLVKLVSEGGYSIEKFQLRNEYIVDNCDLLVACYDGTPGGTKNCIDYAIKKSLPTVIIDPLTRKMIRVNM